jgi:hypothetical protein
LKLKDTDRDTYNAKPTDNQWLFVASPGGDLSILMVYAFGNALGIPSYKGKGGVLHLYVP